MNIFAEKNEGTQTEFLWSFWARLLRACLRFWKKAGKKTTKIVLLYLLANVVSFSKKLVCTFCRKSAFVYTSTQYYNQINLNIIYNYANIDNINIKMLNNIDLICTTWVKHTIRWNENLVTKWCRMLTYFFKPIT